MNSLVNLSKYKSLQPHPPSDLCRLGGPNDGGYVVSSSSVSQSKYLLSFGIFYDVNFEFDFVKFQGEKVVAHMYDASTHPFSLEHILSELLKSVRFHSLRPILGYLSFLRKRRFLLQADSIFQRRNVSDFEHNGCTTLTKALQALERNAQVFLKVDIEGDEILIIPEILSNIDYFSGIVIEFHRAHAIWDLLITFVETLSKKGMHLDHLHVCNYGGVSLINLPSILELSFSRVSRRGTPRANLPVSGLDTPNSPVRSDYEVIF